MSRFSGYRKKWRSLVKQRDNIIYEPDKLLMVLAEYGQTGKAPNQRIIDLYNFIQQSATNHSCWIQKPKPKRKAVKLKDLEESELEEINR